MSPIHPFTLEAALALARRELAVFPIQPWSRIPEKGWQKAATTDPTRVHAHFAEPRNIGVACRASKILVLDLDRHNGGPDGIAGWEALCAEHGQVDTFGVVTPSGGLHVYFKVPTGTVITSSSGPRPGLPPGIDVRAPGRRSGGYVMGPGSQLDAGRYRVARDVPMAVMPGWVGDRLQANHPRA